MRRMKLAVLAAFGGLTACGGATDAPAGNTVAAPAGEPTVANAVPPTPEAPAAAASKTEIKTDDFSFAYSYPAAAAAIGPLRAWLDKDRDTLRAVLVKDTADARREAKAGDFPYRAYDSSVEWKTVTDTPRLLSLSAQTYAYTGGAHGMPGYAAMVWDKVAGQRLDPVALFTSKEAIQTALGAGFCDRLDTERAKRRGEPVKRGKGDDDPFNDCPKVEEATLILGSTDRAAINRIGLLVGPYVAGPYAEGSFDLTLPVTPAVLAAVKPEYRDAFAAR
ncbi:DUF4163 domain-containing protein [Sphingomonas sp.]|uniref:DUF4163 domain-containing protein n=1 Tax=Sphingomonas sp. TaxID=28214 RepID=UPI002C186DEA|nr:DUF4163 domain-containing protein [Sphingomonas sp.]HWK35750.1 DUF4163 domain-containing protein [Sphingomonas sp.]